MWTPCPNIDHSIAPLILWKECNLHSNPSIICHKTNLQHFMNTSMRISKRVHSTFKVFSWCAYLLYKKERWLFANVCWLSWIESTYHKKSVPFAHDLKVIEPTQSCQGLHQDYIHGTYNLVHIQEGDEWKTSYKTCYGHFEYVMMPFGLINTFAVFQRLMNDVFCEYLDDFMVCYIDDIFFFLKVHGGPWTPCTFDFGKVLGGWTLCQIGKLWILSI
jgi:hypothetical protein